MRACPLSPTVSYMDIDEQLRERLLDLSQHVDGPFTVTFTGHVPFPIGVPNGLNHTLSWGAQFLDESASKAFPSGAGVTIRVFETTKSGMRLWQEGTDAALKTFYGYEFEHDLEARYSEDTLLEHNQWITLETPHAPVVGEDPNVDRGFAFHRCLFALNVFLQSSLLLTGDIRVRSIRTRDLRPYVIIGALQKDVPWRMLAVMDMHPAETLPDGITVANKPFTQEQLNGALSAILSRKPYIQTALWRARAQRAYKHTGDGPDAVISFQIAAESLLFETYKMILVDEGKSSAEISAALGSEIPFRTLVTRLIASKLGGRWDVTAAGTAVGDYWTNLYLVRNSIIHTGMQAHEGHAEQAQKAYWGLRDYLESRLWAKRRVYPRTLLVRLGTNQLKEKGWLTAELSMLSQEFDKEPYPFYWPYDQAQRPKPGT
jgi:hypothetical protein